MTSRGCFIQLYKLFPELRERLEKTKGKDVCEVIVKSSLPASENNRAKEESVMRHSLRRLRLDWMYEDHTFPWLNDQVCTCNHPKLKFHVDKRIYTLYECHIQGHC